MSGSIADRVRSLVLLVAVACVGCAANVDDGASEHAATTSEAITNADDDDGDPAVVALVANGQPYCTGVLVTSHVVATAAHCVTPTPPDQVFFGSKPGAGGKLVAVADTKAFPDFDEDTLANDIGLVALADQAPTAPLAVRTAELDKSFVGMPIRLVGFGVQSANDDGNIRKRTGKSKIESYADDDFRFKPDPSQTCSGDSGGPALATIDGKESVIGLASSGDVDCKVYGSDMRIDRFVPFITGFVKAYSAKIAPKPGNQGCSASPAASGARAHGPAELPVSAWLGFALGVILWRRRTLCAKERASRGETVRRCKSVMFFA